MRDPWNDHIPTLRGELTTIREIAPSDLSPLFVLFADPAVTAYMAPPPPTPARFAGFVEWSHEQRVHGHGACFAIVPDGMTAAVGILQVRLDAAGAGAEWGFVLSAHFWSSGVFSDAARQLVAFVFSRMPVDRLEARIALRNGRAQAAVQKLGARFETTLEEASPKGIPRDPEAVWILRQEDWQDRPRRPQASPEQAAQRLRAAVEAAESQLHRRDTPAGVEPYPLFLFDRRRRE